MRTMESGLRARQDGQQRPLITVCPICWRKNCSLFVRLQGYKFTDDEKTRFFVAFHRDVCEGCRKLKCSATMPAVCVARKFNHKLHAYPAWWKGEKS